MYTLLHGLYKYLVQKDEYFVLILGLDNAGKTVGHPGVGHSEVMGGCGNCSYQSFIDLPGGGEDEIHEELQGYESEQDHDYRRPEHRQDRHRGSIL